ncbi:hypothetical protein FGK63_14925 [Ruegeria sediminis]|uniref:Uncharacterized protein n=1 Tax=Ruegeria sediminis TaxID=2583820 RepID=A0ABY2WVY6_9RHOB|nr:hypothetical protein [Ruegeria sediminis]TMV06436.1 hypothetical protein FGK63_14925 [Ruegeria sediminis]
MAKTLKDLLLALLNATLLLLALCLFLAWKVSSTIDGLAATFAQNLQMVAPLREEAQAVQGELQGLRKDLEAVLQEKGEELTAATQQRISGILDRAETVEKRLQSAQMRITELADAPEDLIDHAIETSVDAIADRATEIRGCTPAS